MRKSIGMLLGLVLFTTPALARDKDLRTMSSASGETEIGFCVRPSPDAFGFPGHSFVTFSATRPGGGRSFRAVGHTVAAGTSPAGAAFTYFGGRPVAGAQMEERYTHLKQACLNLKVDRAAYDRAVAAARPTLTALGFSNETAAALERYSLNGNDCIDFAVRVADALAPAGLRVPARSAVDTPRTYLEKLIAANP
ncbi:MAG: hypothetical protein IIZ38_12800 [Sphingomonas sp.]|uniref:hypothetical protein n=1 Tax=Sphingomonas sp. TaxID=28214 RepID=UPI0025CB9AED|nr:hypothetical protein [Sphingomonas sp.]MBQ1499185.1 hypothetical protein [Sphingomonas sp.]